MGRPLNKKWFSGDNNLNFQLGCTVRIAGTNYETSIIRQRSNSKYEVAGVGETPLTYTSLAFADADPDTITRTGGADFTATFSAGDQVRVASSENAGENDGVYTIATVAASVITLVAGDELVTNADDTTATLALVTEDDTVIASLVEGAPTLDNTMQIVVSIDSAADESARIINAHQVKTFEGNTYVWPDVTPAGGNRAGLLEADLQETS